ncbi:MAG: glutathione S-transferase family protein [Myxococcales bacterium]|nr:MAG: glutathione S-transferase family protein [Myxococcales bacterium]
MILYVDRFAPNVRRVLMFIDEKGINVPVIELNIESGEHRSPRMLELNPLGQLPILELDDGGGLSESTAICRYLEELHPEPALFGENPTERALVEMWLRRVELGLFTPAVEYGHHTQPFFHDRFVQIAAWAALCRDRVAACCSLLERTLATSSYVAGDRFTVADVTAYCGIEIAILWGIGGYGDLGALTAWRGRIGARPSAAAARYLE